MPLVIFSRARLGLNPSVNAVAAITVAVVAVASGGQLPSPVPSVAAAFEIAAAARA